MRLAIAAAVVLAVSTALASSPAQAADDTPVGLWHTIDDNSGKIRSQVRIYEQDGVLYGKIEKIIIPGKTDRCVLCTDERKDQPALGLVIIRKMKKAADSAGEWNGGDILDPEKGAVYTSRMQLSDDGQTLSVRGYVGIPLLGRSQTWTRVKP
jgi:uncharacterized protein (DUF2147 family)